MTERGTIVRTALRRILATTASAQGVAGVACVAGGAFLLWGVGVALLVVGVFLLVGAWGSR